ncbi:unnamed protein product [Vitrella brassicaformis CCMP3155]|uniref:Uncharacterized protein n=2 Tax=Vitrella brassicaformis TaxID=1169539 RepID=A0A0G4F8Q4_VITBC|nr:unnamed protein product [Vitrella brassicaformis CCMP3155]|eukprot:CEM08564.1 unnamed protein product [Vitrella brassicaformis CCMP3155]
MQPIPIKILATIVAVFAPPPCVSAYPQSVLVSYFEYWRSDADISPPALGLDDDCTVLGMIPGKDTICIDLDGYAEETLALTCLNSPLCCVEGQPRCGCGPRLWQTRVSVSPGGNPDPDDDDQEEQPSWHTNQKHLLRTVYDHLHDHPGLPQGMDLSEFLRNRHESSHYGSTFNDTVSIFTSRGGLTPLLACSFAPYRDVCVQGFRDGPATQQHVWILRAVQDFPCYQDSYTFGF